MLTCWKTISRQISLNIICLQYILAYMIYFFPKISINLILHVSNNIYQNYMWMIFNSEFDLEEPTLYEKSQPTVICLQYIIMPLTFRLRTLISSCNLLTVSSRLWIVLTSSFLAVDCCCSFCICGNVWFMHIST